MSRQFSTQGLLEKSIEYFGTNDLVTIMLSQKRDREIVEEQRRMLHEKKQSNQSA